MGPLDKQLLNLARNLVSSGWLKCVHYDVAIGYGPRRAAEVGGREELHVVWQHHDEARPHLG